jgi:hypothetical protein
MLISAFAHSTERSNGSWLLPNGDVEIIANLTSHGEDRIAVGVLLHRKESNHEVRPKSSKRMPG